MTGIDAIVGDSPPMRRLKELISRVAPTTLSVLIHGPTGAGKELVAQAVHEASGRRGRFVSFNVCAIADAMFETTLFGHKRGAFTGAIADSPGLLLEANGGTIFMDEISGLPMSQQIKLLRAIETRSFRPVGGREDRRSDFRVIAATNEDLWQRGSQGQFRKDLLHRLSGITIEVPPLHARLDDIPLLVEHFLADGRSTVTPEAFALLRRHEWPGNVRELRHTLERARVLSDGAIDASDIKSALPRHYVENLADGSITSFARQQLRDVLEDNGWDVVATANVLGIHWTTVYRRMRRLGIPLRPRGLMRDERQA